MKKTESCLFLWDEGSERFKYFSVGDIQDHNLIPIAKVLVAPGWLSAAILEQERRGEAERDCIKWTERE